MLNRVNQIENVILKQSTTNDEISSQDDDDKIFISQKLCDYITSIYISTTQ